MNTKKIPNCSFCLDESLQNENMLHHIHVSKKSKVSAIISCLEDHLEVNSSLVLLFSKDTNKLFEKKFDHIPEYGEDVIEVSERTVTNTKSNFLPMKSVQEYKIHTLLATLRQVILRLMFLGLLKMVTIPRSN